MKKGQFYSIFFICLTSLLLWSCVNLTKRKHRSGYHIEWDLVKLKKKASSKNTQEDSLVYASIDKGFPDYSNTECQEKLDSTLDSEISIVTIDKSMETTYESDSVDSIQNTFSQSKTSYKNNRYLKDVRLPDRKGGFLYWSIGGITILALATRKKAKKLSQWAAENKKLAQVMVGLSSLSLPVVSFLLGWLEGDGSSTGLKMGLFSGLGLLSIGAYLHKRSNKGFFLRKFKELFFIIAMVGFFNTAGNKLSENFHKSEKATSFEKSVEGDFVKSSLDTVDETSKKLSNTFGKVFLSLLLLVVCYLLGAVLLFLSCSLLCSGYGVLALLLAIGGTFGMLGLFAFGLINIWKKHRGKKDTLTYAERSENKRIRTNVLMILLAFIIGLIVLGSINFFGYLSFL